MRISLVYIVQLYNNVRCKTHKIHYGLYLHICYTI